MNSDRIDNDTTRKSPDLIGIALRTAITAFAAVVLATALFTTWFPYDAMLYYVDIGNNPRALECAANFINLESPNWQGKNPPTESRYVSALYTAGRISITAYKNTENAEKKTEYANSVLEYTEKYLGVFGISERNDKINSHNIKNQQIATYHPSLYSYRDYLARYNYLARCTLSKREEWLYAGKRAPITDLTSLFYNESFVMNNSNTDEIAEALNMLSEMVAYDFSAITSDDYMLMGENEIGSLGAKKITSGRKWFYPLIDDGKKTGLLVGIERHFTAMTNYAYSQMESRDNESQLRVLYVMRALSRFADNMDKMLTVLCASEHYPEILSADYLNWRGMNRVDYLGGYALRDYYNNVLLPRYKESLTNNG